MIEKLATYLLSVFSTMKRNTLLLSRNEKRLVAVVFDISSAILTVWMAFAILLQQWHHPEGIQWMIYLLAPAIMLPVFTSNGLYRAVYRYSGFTAFITVLKAVLFYGAAFLCIVLLAKIPQIPISVGILQPMMFLISTGGSRALVRFFLHSANLPSMRQGSLNRLLIYGAGAAGVEIVNAIHRSAKFDLAGFIDDDEELHGRTINGMPVFSAEQAKDLINKEMITNILLAMPSVSRVRRKEIVETFRKYPVCIQMLPGVEELADGRVTISDIKPVEIEDLLGRDPVPADHVLVESAIAGKVVMVTGAGGSIGSEICRQLLLAKPSKILLIDQAEHNLYTIHSDLEQRLSKHNSGTLLFPLLCDVTDERHVDDICRVFEPAVIYHAAAYKHVPMVEHNPGEGVRNNVYGTLSVAKAARKNRISSFVLVSTDKAVRPTNVMGASKRLCEMILQAFAEDMGSSTCYSMVRFGNVLGSSGSVVPLFRRQIREGGPLTITHKEITRYFMTIPEAAQLVIQAGVMATGGDVYLLDMGEPVNIVDLARNMVKLSGLTIRDKQNAEGDIEIHFTGLRPGEKLYEELLLSNEPQPTIHPRIFKANEHFIPWLQLKTELAHLSTAISLNDSKSIKRLLKKIVSEYQPISSTTDYLTIEEENMINVAPYTELLISKN
jgi:FlaA1/EpsC-like NDP-sugar epimerase